MDPIRITEGSGKGVDRVPSTRNQLLAAIHEPKERAGVQQMPHCIGPACSPGREGSKADDPWRGNWYRQISATDSP